MLYDKTNNNDMNPEEEISSKNEMTLNWVMQPDQAIRANVFQMFVSEKVTGKQFTLMTGILDPDESSLIKGDTANVHEVYPSAMIVMDEEGFKRLCDTVDEIREFLG